MSIRPHWTTAVENHPIARLIVPCFVPPGKEARDVINRVELGRGCLKIVFRIGQRHTPIPMSGQSTGFRVLNALLDDYPDTNFSIEYDTVQDPGIYATLAAIVTWAST